MVSAAAAERTTPGGDAEVVKLTRAQHNAAVRKALKSLGLTYDQLADQARKREFSSPRAQMLWVAIRED